MLDIVEGPAHLLFVDSEGTESRLRWAFGFKNLEQSSQDLEIFGHDVEDGAIVDVGDANLVDLLHLVLHMLLAIPNDDGTLHPVHLVGIRPLLPDALAGVKEPSLGGADGTDAAAMGLRRHGGKVIRRGDGPMPVGFLRNPT